ncbi:MAG: RNA polymerase sigma factor [Acidobacteriota bacterium]
MSSSSIVDFTRHTQTPGDMIRAATSVQCYMGGTMDVEASRVPFEDVAQELSDPLRRYLERLVGDRATADDLLQETLLKIARGLPEFEGRSSVKTWAFTIATRAATDHFRRPQSRARMVEIDESGATHVTDAEIDQRLVIDEMSSCVREVIDSLPEDYRTALVLHDLEGQTAAHVAEIVDCSLATAKIRIHRARRRLKEALDQECRFYRDENNVFRCDRKRGC